jgi:hypothetical protein
LVQDRSGRCRIRAQLGERAAARMAKGSTRHSTRGAGWATAVAPLGLGWRPGWMHAAVPTAVRLLCCACSEGGAGPRGTGQTDRRRAWPMARTGPRQLGHPAGKGAAGLSTSDTRRGEGGAGQ